ncbi:hypothetical protein M885DRAFT_510338 [Pelagophyceae sp. CCMP2097]|nr:hypothetical protein M885DRAFT_510338 [Pelagophyceae sp. CCMP2097]
MSFAMSRLLRPAAFAAAKRPLIAARNFSGAKIPGKVGGKKESDTFYQIWLTDPATYPIIVIIGGALIFCSTVMARAMFLCPDVRITKTARQQVIRDWS